MKRLFKASRQSILAMALLVAGGTTAYADIPLSPQNLSIDVTYPENPMEPYTASLTWNASDDADGYRIYVKTLGEEWQGGQFELIGETSETSYALEDRLEIGNAAYAFFVAAYNGDGDSPASNIVSSACGRVWNEGDLGEYNGSGLTAIVTRPGKTGRENTEYRYDVNTFAEYTSNPAHSVEYSVDGPEGMVIDGNTGEIYWATPAAGTYMVTVTARATTGNEYDQQLWQLEVQPEAVTSVNDNVAASSVVAYPNPATSHLTLNFSAQAGSTLLTLSDAAGTEVMKQTVVTTEGANTASFNVGTLAAGRYFLRIVTGTGTTVLPLAITR